MTCASCSGAWGRFSRSPVASTRSTITGPATAIENRPSGSTCCGALLLIAPLLIAATWKQIEAPQIPLEPPVRDKRVYAELFYLIYPLLVLFMSLRIARERLWLAAVVVLLSFVCSSTRQLLTQNRLILAKEALRREASRDGLTSLWNRKAILGILERELLRAERDQAPVGVIMIDVDHFKKVNDSRGHQAGDDVLRIIASGIAAVVRPYDAVGRYGGEEFLIVAPGCGMTETWELAERVRVHVADCNIMAGGSTVRVSLSLGVATGHAANDIEKVLNASDAALYQAKNAGRNRVEPSLGRAASATAASPGTPHRDFWISSTFALNPARSKSCASPILVAGSEIRVAPSPMLCFLRQTEWVSILPTEGIHGKPRDSYLLCRYRGRFFDHTRCLWRIKIDRVQ